MTSVGEGNRGGAVAVNRGVPAVPLPSRGPSAGIPPNAAGPAAGSVGPGGLCWAASMFLIIFWGGLWGRAGVASLESRLRPALWSAVWGKS